MWHRDHDHDDDHHHRDRRRDRDHGHDRRDRDDDRWDDHWDRRKDNNLAKESALHNLWRPALAWLCVAILALHYMVFPITEVIGSYYEIELRMPTIGLEGMISVVLALIGLGGFRTYEKVQERSFQREHRFIQPRSHSSDSDRGSGRIRPQPEGPL